MPESKPPSLTPKPITRSRHRCYECFRQIMECTCDDMWNDLFVGEDNED